MPEKLVKKNSKLLFKKKHLGFQGTLFGSPFLELIDFRKLGVLRKNGDEQICVGEMNCKAFTFSFKDRNKRDQFFKSLQQKSECCSKVSSANVEKEKEDGKSEELTRRDWVSLLKGARRIKMKKGETIGQQGASDLNFYFLEKGVIEILVMESSKLEQQRRIFHARNSSPAFSREEGLLVGHIKEGQTFGETNFMFESSHSATLRAANDVKLCIIEGFFLVSLFKNKKRLETKFCKYIAFKLASRYKELDPLGFDLVASTLKITRGEHEEIEPKTK